MSFHLHVKNSLPTIYERLGLRAKVTIDEEEKEFFVVNEDEFYETDSFIQRDVTCLEGIGSLLKPDMVLDIEGIKYIVVDTKKINDALEYRLIIRGLKDE